MKKPYAESTLRRKYRETGLGEEKISLIHDYLFACARFYKIIEMDEVQKILFKQGRIPQAEMDAVFPIMERDDFLEYYIISEKDLYQDGEDQKLLIYKSLLIDDNPDFDQQAASQATKNGEEYDLSDMIQQNWEKFYQLNEQRSGKPLYVPKDMWAYADGSYYEKTPQTEAMKTFLKKECTLNKEWGIFSRLLAAQGFPSDPSDEEIADWTVLNLIDLITDLSLSFSEQIKESMEMLEYIGYTLKEKHMQRYVDLFSDMSNHTRMPSNRGFTPDELFRRSGGTAPKEISFGPGMQKMLRSGEFNAEEFKRLIMGDAELPMEVKASILRETKRALNPSEEKWVGSTLIKGEKIRPNDPCPCGSGKKYKKCCGAKR